MMGSQFLCHFPLPICRNCYSRFLDDGYGDGKILWWRCFSGGRSGGSRWDWEKNVNPRQRSRFTDSYVAEEYDEEYSFRNSAKERIWWSDEDDDEDDEGFGILEASIGFNWVFKLLKEHSISVATSKISTTDKCKLPAGIRLFVSAAHTEYDLRKAAVNLACGCNVKELTLIAFHVLHLDVPVTDNDGICKLGTAELERLCGVRNVQSYETQALGKKGCWFSGLLVDLQGYLTVS
ncbi:UNVERIFIED_CONTAM: Long chain base biosynthesis protein 1b [Sesamum indicum]